MPLAHIRSGVLIKRFETESGWMELEDGRRVSPPVDGFVDGNDRIVPVVEETVDNSTGPDTATSRETIIEAAQVVVRRTIRDLTAEEIDGRKEAQISRLQDVFLEVVTNHENRIRALESRPAVTRAQVRNFLKGLI